MSKEIVLEVRDDVLEKTIFTCFPINDVIYNLFITYFLMPIILKYIDIYIENNSSHLNNTI